MARCHGSHLSWWPFKWCTRLVLVTISLVLFAKSTSSLHLHFLFSIRKCIEMCSSSYISTCINGVCNSVLQINSFLYFLRLRRKSLVYFFTLFFGQRQYKIVTRLECLWLCCGCVVHTHANCSCVTFYIGKLVWFNLPFFHFFSAVDCVDHTQVHSCKPREVVIFGENQEENVVYLVKIVEIEIERYQGTLKAPIYLLLWFLVRIFPFTSIYFSKLNWFGKMLAEYNIYTCMYRESHVCYFCVYQEYISHFAKLHSHQRS